MEQGALGVLEKAGLIPENIRAASVPGSYELPVAARWMLESGCDAVVCIGCLIKGDTPHFEFISESVAKGLMDLNLQFGKPVIFAVITTLTHEQALDRAGACDQEKGLVESDVKSTELHA
jgi:6,7-dimethyl-8-ribityllumazine synthase